MFYTSYTLLKCGDCIKAFDLVMKAWEVQKVCSWHEIIIFGCISNKLVLLEKPPLKRLDLNEIYKSWKYLIAEVKDPFMSALFFVQLSGSVLRLFTFNTPNNRMQILRLPLRQWKIWDRMSTWPHSTRAKKRRRPKQPDLGGSGLA